jgi:DNA-binding FadR family transcriptional regulator
VTERADSRAAAADPTAGRADGAALGGSVADRVATRLLDMIARGELTPGQRLPGERALAEQMGVSRVSVRAALQRLKTQGFLVAVQGGGTRVVSSAAAMDDALTAMVRTKLDNLHDLAEIRVALETWAARRAAERASDADIAEIKARLDAMAAASPRRAPGDPAEGGSAPDKAFEDVQFHLAIGKAADSPVYMHVLSVIRDILMQMLAFHRYELFLSDGDDATVLAHHRAIFEAIAARDPDAAAAAMQRHLSWVLEHYGRARGRRDGVPAGLIS